MKKLLVALAAAATLVGGAGAAVASPVAPRAAPTAPRAAVARPDATKPAAKTAGPGFCLNGDRDNKYTCILHGPPRRGCAKIVALGYIIGYYRCGTIAKPPFITGACLNPDRDNKYLCLYNTKPRSYCKTIFRIPNIVGYYRCTPPNRGAAKLHL